MEEIKIIELKESVFADNDAEAEKLRQSLKAKDTFLVNVMSSPGAGKTSTLKALIPELAKDHTVSVMEADIDGAIDADEIQEETGAHAVQLHTGGMCHLDAGMTEQGIASLGDTKSDIVFLENVGNLVCPAEFDTGAAVNAVILSVPEGDDKPLKYPLMFEKADVVILNKCDVLPYFDFDMDLFKKYLRDRNDSCDLIPISAKTGEGVPELVEWFQNAYEAWRA
ncbi:MAG: hydrogenase nickel incorporation protein HypB [Atopobiaceae bacterium]